MFYSGVFSLALFMSLFPVVVVVLIRNAVLQQRQNVIKDLAKGFNFKEGAENDLIPSFEFVKFKYLLEDSAGELIRKENMDYSWWHWAVGAAPLAIVTLLLSSYVICIIALTAFNFRSPGDIQWIKFVSGENLFPWVIVVSFVGSHLRMLRNFFVAVNNFDLSPSTFIDSTIDVLLGVTVALLFYFGFVVFNGGNELRINQTTADATGIPILSDIYANAHVYIPDAIFAVVIISSFAFAYYPDVARRLIVKSSRLKDYKTEDDKVFNAFKITPVEVIDGIDSDIRDRLESYHINCVQNLATANPLMLYVETPYGVYQLVDWVAQAQLCAAVGVSKLVRFWALGIRTIFDLERFATDKSCDSEAILRIIGNILFDGVESPAELEAVTAEMIVADITSMLHSSHVHRLRQIVITIGDRIGSDYRRLPPIFVCNPPIDFKGCPYAKREAKQTQPTADLKAA
jgi:hypothetical protein